MICILTVSYNQAFIDPELELLYDKPLEFQRLNYFIDSLCVALNWYKTQFA